MTRREWLRVARERLALSGSPDPKPDAEWLLSSALGESRARLLLRGSEPLSPEIEALCGLRLKRREAGEPLQYILGEAWFYGRAFRCDHRALIPRQDTETLCEAALARLPKGKRAAVLDLCAGSGILAITIALERPDARVSGADISADALSLARENADSLGAAVRWLRGDLFAPVAGERFDLIVCNPPYLTAEDMRSLQREVTAEPREALFGGEDGLAFYERIAREAPERLFPGGRMLLEIGRDQAKPVSDWIRKYAPSVQTGVLRDINGLDRVVLAEYRP